MRIAQQKRTLTKSKVLVALLVIAVFIGGLAVYAKATDSWPFQQTNDSSQNTNDATQAADDSSTTTSKNASSENNKKKGSNDNEPATKPSSSVTPDKPSGAFVSNHHPNLSGTPAPNAMTSSCVTTPGVDCRIEFTKDGVTKTLSTKKTDASGNAHWSWKLQDINLTKGQWQVTAVASNGDKQAQVTDPMLLDVQP